MTIEEQRRLGREVMAEIVGSEIMSRRDGSTNAFNAPLRRLSEAYAYGDVWARQGIDRRVRSLITLGLLTALGTGPELETHVHAALNNGCTVEEIQEALYHTAIYCGIPRAIDAFRVAETVIRERGLL